MRRKAPKAVREVVIEGVAELRAELGLRRACGVLGLPRAAWYRRISPRPRRPKGERLPRPDRLSPADRDSFLEVAHMPEFVDKPPAQIFFALLDNGCYICCIRKMHQILAQEGELRERRDQLRHPNYQRPELLATGPNQLWSWDITKLRGPTKGYYFQLYVVLDVYSRYVVGWLLATHESDELAQQLLFDSCEKQSILPNQLTVHADRGPSMTSLGVAGLLERLDVRKTHSRPGISDDNPLLRKSVQDDEVSA